MADRGWEVVEDWGVEPDDHVVEGAKNAPVDPRRFSLNKDPYYSGYDAVRDEDKKTRWSDVGQALKIGAINTAEAPAIVADYATSGAIGSDARREAELTKRDIMAGMTPQGRRAATAPFLAEEGQEGALDVGMKDWLMMGAAQNAAPMFMSIVPAWMATGIAARAGMGLAAQGAVGAGVARGTSAVQNMADVTSSIFDEVDNLPDEKLKSIPLVQQYLDEGMSIADARGRYRTEVAKHYPVIAAVIGAIGAQPEAEAVKTLAGASAKRGLKGAIGQIAGGAVEEFGEEGSGAVLSEIAGSQAGLSDIDYHNIVSSALGGAAQGGVLHGPSALVHLGADNVAPDQKLALDTQSNKTASPQKPVSPSQPVTSEVASPPPNSAGEAVDATMSAQLPPDVLASIDASLGPVARPGVGPAGEAILNQRRAPLPDDLGREISSPNEEADAWEAFDDWGQPDIEPDIIRYDDGTTEQVAPSRAPTMTSATVNALRQAEAARAQPAAVSEDEYRDAYDDYRAEQNNEPDVAYGVDEQPDEDQEFAPAAPASSSVQTEPELPRKNPVARRDNTVKLGNLTMQFNPDSIHYDVKGGPGLTLYGDKAFIPGGRKDSIKVSEANSNGVPSQIATALSDYLNAPADQKEDAIQNTIGVLENLGVKQPSSSVQTEATSEVTPAKPARRPRRTPEQIAADNAAKEAARLQKQAAREEEKTRKQTEKTQRAIEAAQKRAADKAARQAEKSKTRNEKSVAVATAPEPVAAPKSEEQSPPSGVIGPVYLGVADKLATKTRVSAEGSHEGKVQRAKRATKKTVAEEEFFNSEHQPGADEVYSGADQSDLLRSDKDEKGTRFIRSDAQRAALKKRLQKFVAAVEKRSGEISPYVTKNSSNYEVYARVAKDVLKYIDNGGERARQALNDFITDEAAARMGDFKPMRKRRLEEGDLNSRPNNELNEETTPSAKDALTNQYVPAPDEMEDHLLEQRKTDMRNAAREILKRQREKSNSVDIGALYIELAKDYPDVIDQFQFRSKTEVENALTEASIEKNTKAEKSGGAIKPKAQKKTEELVPQPKREISKEENDRYVQMLADNAKRDAERSTIRATPKEETPIWEQSVRISTAAAKNETLTAKERLAKATSELASLRSDAESFVAQKNYTAAKQLDERMRELEGEIKRLKKTTESSGPKLFASRGALAEIHNLRAEARNVYLEGMAGERLNPSVINIAGDTYIRTTSGTDYRPVIETHTLGKILSQGFRHGPSNPKLTQFVTALIKKYASDVPVHIVSMADLDQILPGSDALYDPSGYIVLPWELSQMDNELFNRLVVHEGIHAVLQQRLNENPVAVSQLHALSQFLRKNAGIPDSEYLWENAHEFLSEVLSRADLQEALKNTPLTPELAAMLGVKEWRQTSIWKALVERIANWLGYNGPMNALEGVLSVVERVERGDVSPNQQTLDYAKQGFGDSFDRMPSIGAIDRGAFTSAVKASPQAAKDQGQAFLNKLKRFATKGATLDQIRQVHAGLFVDQKGNDLLGKLVSTIQRMAPKAQKLREQSDALSQRFINLKKSNPEEADAFAQLAIDATMANVRLGPGADNDHLNKGGRNAQGKGRLADLQRDYAALSSDAKQLYQDMAAYYRSMQNEMARNIVENRLNQYGVNPANRKAFIDRVIAGKLTDGDKLLFKDNEHALDRLKQISQLRVVQGDYFPLMRNGSFIVTTNNKIKDLMGGTEIEPGKVEFRAKTDKEAKRLAEQFAANVDLPQTNWQKSPVSQANDFGYIVSVQTRGAHFFESEADAIAWRRENATNFDEVSEVSPIRQTGQGSTDLTTAQLNSLQATVRNSNYSEEEKEAMLDMLQQGSAVLMSGNRIQKRGIARRKVLGASNDFGRNVVQYGEAVSNRLAQLEFRPEIDDTLKAMREIDKNLMDKNHPERTTVLNEITARIDSNATAANEPGKFMKVLMTLAFLGKLASPMYSVINGMQPWMVTYPVLAGRYGPARAASMLTEAYGAIGFSDQALAGLRNTYLAGKNFNDVAILNTTDVVESIRAKLKSQSDGAELNKVIDMLLERGAMSAAGFEMAQSIAQGRGVWGSTLAKVDRIARQLPQAVEDMNRAVSAIAAYRLARASMSEEKARDFAFTTVMNTQGDYSGVNAPRFFNNPVLRPAVQFKKYAQMMVYLLADMTHRAFGPNTSKEERKVALSQLGSVMGVQIAMAGALSLPGIEIAKLGFMVAGALGMGGGWDDEEEKLRKLADDTFGKTWGELLTRGVVSRALNIDLSQRLSLADMATFGEPGDYERDGVDAYLWRMFAGAPYSTINDMRKGVQDAVDGDFGKAAERFFPVKIISDAFKAANGYSEGKVTPFELGMNIFGVKSGRQAEQSRNTGNQIRAGEKVAAVHKELTDAYLKAKNAGERMKLRAKIIEFNKSAPLRQKVFPNALDKVRQRIDAERVN